MHPSTISVRCKHGTPASTRSQNPRERARLSQRDAVRGRLCDAAAKLFLEEGEAALSMRRLAAEVGCSPMAPYRHFADKEALVAAIRAQAFDRLADALDSVEQNERHRARDIGEAYVQFARENPAAYKLMFDLAQPDEAAYPELAAAAARARISMSAYVHELVDAGVLAGDPVELGYVFWSRDLRPDRARSRRPHPRRPRLPGPCAAAPWAR